MSSLLTGGLAAELRCLQRLSGQSLRELERTTFASHSSLARYLSGQTLPPWAVVEALCRLGGRDPRELRALWEHARRTRQGSRRGSAPAQRKPARSPYRLATSAAAGSMPHRRLGTSGPAVSTVGVGCDQFGQKVDRAGARAIVETALDVGITFFDAVGVDGDPPDAAEELLGAALSATRRRADLVIATTVGHGAPGGAGHIHRAVEASLRRLGTDYVDLCQMNWPGPATPIDETLSALDYLVRAGKIRYAGCANVAAWQVADAVWTAWAGHLTSFVSVQHRYLLNREVQSELVPVCERFGLGLLPSYVPGECEVEVGALATKPAVASVIASVTSAEQVRATVAAVTRWQPRAPAPCP